MADPSAASSKKPLSKTEIVNSLAESTGLTKQQITQVLEDLGKLIGQSLSGEGAGTFTLPGLLKIVSRVKPATPEHMGVNPFTKEPKLIAAKPESRTVKVTALKGLKDMAQ